MNREGASLAPRRRFGLTARLFVGFGLGIALVGLLLGLGDRAISDASFRVQQTLADHVRPLALLHHLQARIGTLRQREIELSRLRDYFPVLTHSESLRRELQAVEDELQAFAGRIAAERSADAERLRDHWRLYRSLIERQLDHAGRMDMAVAAAIAETESLSPYTSIELLLGDSARLTESAADAAYRQMQVDHERQRQMFKLLALGGSLALLGGLAVFGHSLVGRVTRLHVGAQRFAAGEEGGSVEVSGGDEIADLGVAFNTMQQKVAAREQALRAAQEELEQRVETRTRDLREANDRLVLFSQAVEQSPVGILIASSDGRIEFVNAAYSRITGHPAEVLLGGHVTALFDAADDAAGLAGAVEDTLHDGRAWETERRSRRSDGSEYWERLRLAPVHDADGRPAHLLLSREDISVRRAQDEKIAFQAHYDPLTGLPNRTLALDRLIQTTTRSQRDGDRAVAMFIDLDNFKEINDTLGHAAGDTLLRQAAARLRGAVRHEDTVARLGGDEFLVIIGGLVRGNDAASIAEKIIDAFEPPFIVEGREFGASPSIGIAVFPDDGEEPSVLLRNSDLAMYEAKGGGRNTYRFFNQAIHDLSLQRLELARCLRGALERGELQLAYQPLIASRGGAVIGAEALLRWHSPELGAVSPERFIPIAEQTGMIVDIGRWVLREACASLTRWRRSNEGFVMAVNVSPRQFRERGFVDMVRHCLGEFGIPQRQLEIEVTEGLLVHSRSEVRDLLLSLEALGVGLSLDDFGTGYSSLSYLREFPFHTIKIDRSFVRDVSDDPGDRALVVAAVRMAKALGLRIIAEGVETEQQRSFLAANECDTLQGWHFGKAVTATDFERTWLSGSDTRAA